MSYNLSKEFNMAFYVVVKGNINNFDFPYLHQKHAPRLAKTMAPGEKKIVKGKNKNEADSIQKEVFAIELMSKNIQTLSPAAKIKEAKQIMLKHKIHHIPIMVDNVITGLLSERDLSHGEEELDQQIRLHKVMSKTILCASEGTTLEAVANVFYHENINSLPIVDEDFFVTGIITSRDILKWLLDNQKFQKN
jgi:CBS domain-containing protein